MNLYSTCTPLSQFCLVYQDSLLLSPAPDGVYYDGTTCWVVSGGQITSSTACITTTTTLPPSATYCFNDGSTTFGPYPDLPTCEAAAGGLYTCFECI